MNAIVLWVLGMRLDEVIWIGLDWKRFPRESCDLSHQIRQLEG